MTKEGRAPAVENVESEQLKIWAHSGDSSVIGPDDLWTLRLPKRLADKSHRDRAGRLGTSRTVSYVRQSTAWPKPS